MRALLDCVENPCLSKDVGAPGSPMRRANDLGRELASLNDARSDLREARAALRELSSLLKSQGVKEWQMTSHGRAALALAEGEK